MFKPGVLLLLFFFVAYLSIAQKTISGVVTEEIKTKDGNIKITRTAHLPKGKTISGTIAYEPESEKPKKREKQLEKLSSLVIKLGETIISGGEIFTTKLPALDKLPFQVFDEGGKIVQEIPLDLNEPLADVSLDLPKTLRSDNIEKISGELSGNIANASVTVGDKPMELVAGNEDELFFKVDDVSPGKHDIVLNDEKVQASESVNVVDYTLQAGRLTLNRGESTYLDVAVTGLKDIQEPLQLEVKNQSVGTISLEGGDIQLIQIKPEEVAERGVWQKRFDIQSLTRGSFSVYTDLTVTEQEEPEPEDATKYIEQAVATEAKVLNIGKMKLVNPTGETVKTGLQSFYIPMGNSGFQGYMVPESQEFVLPPNAESWVDLEGYCTDFDLSTPEAGSGFPSADNWFQVEDPRNVEKIQNLMIQEDIQKITHTDLSSPLNVPGTDMPITHVIERNDESELYKRLLMIGLNEIIDSYEQLEEDGLIEPAFIKNNKEKTVQSAFWDYAEKLKGKKVDKSLLEEKLQPQIPDNIWKNIELIGEKAKIYPEKEKKKSGQCEFICPQNNTSVAAENVCFEWNCPENNEGPFNLTVIPKEGSELNFQNIERTQFSLGETLIPGMGYEALLSYSSPSGIMEGPSVLFNVNPDCMADLQEIMAKLDSIRQLVQDAGNELEGNPLVAEARLIDMITEILETPETITELFDEWLEEEFSFPDISDSATFESVTREICGNLDNIKKALGYGKKIASFMQSQGQGNSGNLTSKIDRALEKLEEACDNAEKFEAFYAELQSAVTDLRGYLAGKLEEFVRERIERTIRRILVNKLGAAAAGSIMNMAMDAWNFIDALIKQGKLEEAKALYNLMFFRMLELANQCSRWHIDDTWNSETNGYPQVEWADCSEVKGKRIKLEAFIRCWEQEEDGAPNQGSFSSTQIELKEPSEEGEEENLFVRELVRNNFQPNCDNCCAFPFQLDMDDLRSKARNCEHAHVIIRVTIGDNEPQEVFGGVVNP